MNQTNERANSSDERSTSPLPGEVRRCGELLQQHLQGSVTAGGVSPGGPKPHLVLRAERGAGEAEDDLRSSFESAGIPLERLERRIDRRGSAEFWVIEGEFSTPSGARAQLRCLADEGSR